MEVSYFQFNSTFYRVKSDYPVSWNAVRFLKLIPTFRVHPLLQPRCGNWGRCSPLLTSSLLRAVFSLCHGHARGRLLPLGMLHFTTPLAPQNN